MNTDELRAAFDELPPLPPPVTKWDEHRHTLRDMAAKDYPARLLKWKPIGSVIAVRCDGYIIDERRELDRDKRDWSKIIIEPGFGENPHVCEDGTSGGLVHQAFHLKQWLDKSGKKVSELDSVFEIGAGYGAMPLIFDRLGFKGTYYIADLPEMALLCEFYLSNIGSLRPVFEIPERADLTIALQSLNEIPMDERGPFEVTHSDGYLMMYKERYGGMDNVTYFENFTARRRHITWHTWQPPYRKGLRWYLVGV